MPHPIKKIVVILTTIVILMFGFSFALAPLYRIVCKATGLNGGTRTTETNSALSAPQQHLITIQFIATNNENLPWEFYPQKNQITVRPEEKAQMFFYAKNNTKHPMTVQAVPSFAPAIAAKYFNKLECFCFRQQTLAPGESKKMPVIFRIDAALPADIQVITLAYTLFDVTKQRKQA